RSRTEPVWTITYQPRMSVSISNAHDVRRSAGIWKRKLRTRKAAGGFIGGPWGGSRGAPRPPQAPQPPAGRSGAAPGPGAPRAVALALDPQQPGGGVAQHGGALGVGQTRRAEDVVHRRPGPREGIVGAHDDLARSGLRHEVAERLGREDERV